MIINEFIILRDARYTAEYQLFPVVTLQKALVACGEEVSTQPFSDRSLEKIDRAIEHYIAKSKSMSGIGWAHTQLLIEDLRQWRSACSTFPTEMDEEKIYELNELCISDIREYLNLDYANPLPLHVVDQLPGRYKGFGFDALNVRPGFDPEIQPGIYIPRTSLRPFSLIDLYHEHVHVAMEPDDGNLHFIEWFDEGAANVSAWLFVARKDSNWKRWVDQALRTFQTNTHHFRIRGWSAKNVAFLILNYGLEFFKFLLLQRAANAPKIDWARLYNYLKDGRPFSELEKCFPSKIPSSVKSNTALAPIEKELCTRVLAKTYPIVISPLSYWALKRFVKAEKDWAREGFNYVAYRSIIGKAPIDEKELANEMRKLSFLSVEALDDALRAWDTVGYYRDMLHKDFIKAAGNDALL